MERNCVLSPWDNCSASYYSMKIESSSRIFLQRFAGSRVFGNSECVHWMSHFWSSLVTLCAWFEWILYDIVLETSKRYPPSAIHCGYYLFKCFVKRYYGILWHRCYNTKRLKGESRPFILLSKCHAKNTVIFIAFVTNIKDCLYSSWGILRVLPSQPLNFQTPGSTWL